MPIQNFTLYDIIADLTPGITGIFVFVPLAWSESLVQKALFSSPFKFGVSLLVFGFVFGRLLHTISGSKPVEILRSLADEIYTKIYSGIFSDRAHQAITESQVCNLAPSFLTRLVEAVSTHFDGGANSKSFEDRIESLPETKSQKICVNSRDEYLAFGKGSAGTKRFEHFGESLLYGERVLYRKYEMLSTFFGNLAFLFSIGAIVYGAYVCGVPYFSRPFPYESLWTANTTGPYPYWWTVPFFLLLSFLCHTQRLKFEHRKHRAFVDDLYLKLREKDLLEENGG